MPGAPPSSAGGDVPAGAPSAVSLDSVPPGSGADTLPAGAPGSSPELDDLFARYGDLGLRFQGRMEMGGEWSRFRPCDTRLDTTCRPSLFPQLRPDVQFSVGLGGTIADRIHVDVDYDETREFSAANDVDVYYQGDPGETIQRLEVGDVSFQLPRSRFLTEGIPAGNFGFRADARLGPVDVQSVWAQQTGDVSTRTFRLGDVDGQPGFVEEDTLVVDDADYVRGQFFFLVDPQKLRGYPHVDALALNPGDAPPDVAPGREPVEVYRFEADPVVRQQVEGYVQAEAVAERDGDVIRESGWFRHLEPEVDYTVHSSGLWIALRRPLGPEEMLAVTYVTETGDTVGTYDPERIQNAGGVPELKLLKAPDAEHRPGRPTWEQEMHQVYRISGSTGVDPSSVSLTVSLGELSGGRTFERDERGRDVTFLRLFGLDEQAPADVLDRSALYDPSAQHLLDRPPVPGLFLVFPTLEPFASPPPVRSEGLTAEEAADLLGSDANARIYTSPDPVERRDAGLFRLGFQFRIQGRSSLTTLSLGALGVRDGSERVWLGDRLLERGIDYRIDYDVGQITLLDPAALLARGPDAQLRVTWEQKQVFRLAPTSVVGLKGHVELGDRGSVDFLGLRQAEAALVNRPTLGVEPARIGLGGVSTELRFGAGWLSRALDRLPGLRVDDTASVEVRGELATSLPDPNTQNQVYIDDFDGSDARSVSLESPDWALGSAPTSRAGADDALPPVLDESDAATLVWQHSWVQETSTGDSVGVFQGFFPRQDIDRQIQVAGVQRREPGLLLTFGNPAGAGPGAESTPGPPLWRSITTVLSPTGMDLSRSQYLEVYVADGDSLTLVLDLGRVSEDAFFVDSAGRVNGIKPGTGQPWGLGILDQEADPRRGEIWSDRADQRGVWDEACRAERARVYRVGDPRADCTRGNGRRDTEDLNENGRLDTNGRYLRWVVELDGSSPYLARTRDETGTGFRLFRIPLQGTSGTSVGGFSREADLRSVEDLRITVAGPAGSSAVLARMRIIGSRWVERTAGGVARGIFGDQPGSGGRVQVGPVSRLTAGPAYSSPPGVVQGLNDPTAAVVGGGGVEYQERSLSIGYDGVAPGDRAEVYYRFSQRPRDFLSYRTARLWAVARRGEWGTGRPLWLFLKVGSDPDNFYLYRKELDPAADPEAVQAGDWSPEITVDFDQWMELRRRAELELVQHPPGGGGEPVEVWSADSTYAVVLRDRGRAPNLAAVREISLGVWNGTDRVQSGEVWVDELRLGSGITRPGAVGYTQVAVRAGGVLDASLSYSDRGAFFRQLQTTASYRSDRNVRLDGTVRLDRFAPASWHLRAPLRVDYDRSRNDPYFLAGSDVRAGRLDGLRIPGDRRTRVSLALSRPVPEGERASWWEGVVSGLEAEVGYTGSQATTVTSEGMSRSVDARLGYSSEPAARRTVLVPGFLRDAVRTLLPGFLEAPLLDGRIRWSPERISVQTAWFERSSRTWYYRQILRLPGEGGVRPVESPLESLETTARLELQPFRTLGADVDLLSVRDLLSPVDATGDPKVRPLLAAERSRLAGLDLGWETNRTIRTRVDWRPELAGWLSTDLGSTTYYGALRDPNLVNRRLVAGDTALALERTVDGRRDLSASLALDLDSLGGSALGAPDERGGVLALLRRGLGSLDRLTLQWQDGLATRYDRSVVDPGAGYQWGWAGPDGYRILDGDTASLAVNRRALRAGGGILLPLDLRIRLSFSTNDSRSVDVRSDRRLRRDTWPDLTATVGSLPLPSVVRPVLSRVSLSSGLRETDQRITFGAGEAQLRTEHAREVPLQVALTWMGGLRTRYQGRFQRGTGTDPVGRTRSERVLHALSVSGSFLPPGRWADDLQRPLRVSAGWEYTTDLNCRVTEGHSDCVAFVDQRNRTLDLTVDTQVQRLEVGLQMSWVDRQSFVEAHQGSTQFQLGLFGQFQLNAGNQAAL